MQYQHSRRGALRLPKSLGPYVFALYMATIMSFLMCLIITWTEFGFGGDYFGKVMNAYRVAMPAAFLCILVVRPLVGRLVTWSVRVEG
ncbi:DUF2798 domain-containing protein [Massilia dura]|uniref:DUF2798 domain-containing protein n=1 Tax=Pseudoduganella dura TaxID=321982 RepID=A0A6I3XM22_9BURK|nr:DUF2798 domain-containing protein [Pseudoduganella dura]MUI15483.1 DUF2798 domain-containing protein [Pseudoduganella dura]GGX79655.1 hypothetical protein GCM10007386_08070 [Pseudoduganella dura]